MFPPQVNAYGGAPPHLGVSSCCTAVYGVLRNRALSAGLRSAPALSAETQSPIELQWLGTPPSATVPSLRNCRKSIEVAGEGAIVSGMAGRYATALFELALEHNAVDPVKADLDRFEALVGESADLARLVRSPVFTAEEQARALGAVLGRVGIGGLSANFLKLVAANRRLFAALDMARAYRALVAQHKGEVTAEVTLARAAERGASRRDQGRACDGHQEEVQVDVKLDPAIIGGLVVKLGSRMVDSSLRTKLNAMKHAMEEVFLMDIRAAEIQAPS